MDDFFLASSLSGVIKTLMKILVLAGGVAFVIAMGERALGFKLRDVLNAVEKRAKDGDVWPAVVLLCMGMLTVAYIIASLGQ